MAKQEDNREDLMTDATAYVRRIEFECAATSRVVFAGFRIDERFSMYFDQDPVYHFDARDRLKGAFVDGRQYRSTGTTLCGLLRLRNATSTVLQRKNLSPEQLSGFADRLWKDCEAVLDADETDAINVLAAVGESEDAILRRVVQRIARITGNELALAPAPAGKRFRE